MDKSGVIAFFKQLAPLTAAEEEIVRARFSGISVPAKTYIMRPGEIAQHIYFVVSGCARICVMDQEGEDISCYFAAEGEFISNYESFLSRKPSPYAIQTLEPCELLMVDRQGLDEIYALTSKGEKIGRLIAELLFMSTMERLTSFYTDSPEARYRKFLDEKPQLVNRIPQQLIAGFIGVRPQSLSRIKRRVLEGEKVNPG